MIYKKNAAECKQTWAFVDFSYENAYNPLGLLVVFLLNPFVYYLFLCNICRAHGFLQNIVPPRLTVEKLSEFHCSLHRFILE